jgi:hypothetical protein
MYIKRIIEANFVVETERQNWKKQDKDRVQRYDVLNSKKFFI